MRAYMARRRKQTTAYRVHMPPMREAERQERISAKIEKALFAARRLLLAVIAAEATALAVLPLAYEERGYSAVGGEWLLVAFVAVLVFWAGGRRK